MLYEVVHCRPYSVSNCVRTSGWIVGGLGLAWFELAAMLALITSTLHPKCLQQSDCYLGQACVSLPASDTTYSRLACEDCLFLGPFTPEPWEHQLPGGGPGNASAACEATLMGPASQVLFANMGLQPSFHSCLFALRNQSIMSDLDRIILALTTILLAMAISEDRREQSSINILRSRVLPITFPAALHRFGRESVRVITFGAVSGGGGHGGRGSGVPPVPVVPPFFPQLLASAPIALTVLVLHRCVSAVVPVAMVANLVTRGASATDILLNGLSMGFVVSLDNLAPAAIHTHAYNDRVLTWANGVPFSEVERSSFRLMNLSFGAPFIVTCWSTLHTFNLVTSGELSCEGIGNFLFYRLGIRCGIWYTLCSEEIVFTLATIRTSLRLWYEKRRLDRSVWLGIVQTLTGSTLCRWLEHFCGCLLAAFLILLTVWLFYQIHWDTELGFGARHYLWGFVEDIFGECAMGGYVMSFPGAQCSHISPYPF